MMPPLAIAAPTTVKQTPRRAMLGVAT